MKNTEFLFEAGVYYTFHEPSRPGREIQRHSYRRFRNGQDFGIEDVWVLGRTRENFLTLLDNWNRKGASGGYLYISA